MKQKILLILLVLCALLLCPCAVFLNGTKAYEFDGEETISVMRSVSGKTDKTEMREYIIGCVAAEMLPTCHPQALMAQAVASYSYALYITENSGDAISDSHDTHQGYISESERKEKWGDDFEKYEKKIEDAVDAVSGYIITYNGSSALTVFHSISSGRTQSAENAWGEDYPYLQSVESSGDVLSPKRISEHIYYETEYVDMLKKNGIQTSGKAEENAGKTELNSDGYVSAMEINGSDISGSEFRKIFGLESACFEVEYSDEEYRITCYGHGHGVGMSQYGADYMARQGSTWQEIILHYYSGAEISEKS